MSGTSPYAQNLVFLLLWSCSCICVKLSSSVSNFLHPITFLLLAHLQCTDCIFRPIFGFYGLKVVFSFWLKSFVFLSSTSYYIFSPIFRKENAKFLIFDNNSGSIEHRALKFAYSRGFSSMTDQMEVTMPTELA